MSSTDAQAHAPRLDAIVGGGVPPTCVDEQVTISGWKVSLTPVQLWTEAYITPADGWELRHVLIAISDVDAATVYCISNTNFTEPLTGTTQVQAGTALFDVGQQGRTVLGVVAGWLSGPQGQQCIFRNAETWNL